MTVYIPKPLVFAGAALATFVAYYIVRHEVPAAIRYIGKFEAM